MSLSLAIRKVYRAYKVLFPRLMIKDKVRFDIMSVCYSTAYARPFFYGFVKDIEKTSELHHKKEKKLRKWG